MNILPLKNHINQQVNESQLPLKRNIVRQKKDSNYLIESTHANYKREVYSPCWGICKEALKNLIAHTYWKMNIFNQEYPLAIREKLKLT